MTDRTAGVLFLGIIAFAATISQASPAQAQERATTPPRIYSASEVDTHATQIADGTVPLYPDSLRPLGIDGKVLAQFIVDTTGLVDTTSILTEAYGQPLFAASVRRALASMHYTVAKKSGQNVAEEIEQTFIFRAGTPEPVVPKTRVSALVDSMMLTGGYKRLGGPAEYGAGNQPPKYPVALIRAGLSAIVYTTFVVDTTGRIEPSTFRVTSVKTWRDGASPYHDASIAPDINDVGAEQAFEQAVRNQIPHLRFIPARVNGRNVRELATQPFSFTILP